MNVHFHLLVPDGVFTETDAGLAFALLPPPTGRDLLAILDRVICRVAQRLARKQPDDAMADDSPPELFAQLQAIVTRSSACAAMAPALRSPRIGWRGPATAGSRTDSSGPGRTAAPTWCSSQSHSCADWSGSSHRLAAIWFATRVCLARPQRRAASSAR